MALKISASLAAAPLDRLREVIQELTESEVEYLHFDIEDGVFVPSITLGTKIIQDVRYLTSLPFDVHLMMVDPEWLISDLSNIGVNRISVHYEACRYPRRTLRIISEKGIQAGIALNPATPLPELSYLRPYLDFVVILTTEPEGPDCPFLPPVLEKVRHGKHHPGLCGLEWVVDGGVNLHNLSQVAAAGADTIVVGRALFANNNLKENLSQIRKILSESHDAVPT